MFGSSCCLFLKRVARHAVHTNTVGESRPRDVRMRNVMQFPFGASSSFFVALAVLLATEGTGTGQTASSSISPSAGVSTSLPQACAEALAANVQALTTVGIKFSVQPTYRVQGLPRAKHENAYMYLDGGKFYSWRARTFPAPKGGNDQVIEEEMSFDGSVFYSGTKRKAGHPSLVKLLGENPGDPYAKNTFIPSAYLDAVGFGVPQTAPQWKDSSLVSTVLQLISTGKVMNVSTEGSTLMLSVRIPEPYVAMAKKHDLETLATEGSPKSAGNDQMFAAYRRLRELDWYRKVELWLDLEKGGAIKRRKDSNPEGKLIQTIECEDFRNTHKANLWLPWKCTVKSYLKTPQLLIGFTDEPNEIDRIEVQEVTFQPRADVSFVLDYGTGTFIRDHSTKAAKAAPSGNVQFIVPAGYKELRDAAIHAQARRLWRVMVMAVNGIVAVVLIYLVLRRKARRHAELT